MKQIILLITSTLLFFYSFTLAANPVEAKKIIPRKGKSQITTQNARAIIKPNLRRDRRALIVNFSNLGVVSSLSYELGYVAQGIPQGVAGTITPTGETTLQRELLFGTCSKNVCRYHTNIKDMKFVVTSELKSGLKVRKSFRVKP